MLKGMNFLLIPFHARKKTRELSNLSNVTEAVTSNLGSARSHMLVTGNMISLIKIPQLDL